MATANSTALASRAADFATDYASASLIIYDSSDNALASHTLTGFSQSAGVLTASSIASVTIAASGTADHAELSATAGTYTLTVGTSDADLVIDDLSFVEGGTSEISSLTVTFSN